MTVRDVLLSAHSISGLSPDLNGIQTGATIRFLAAATALVVRSQGKPTRCFDPPAIDAALSALEPHTNLYDLEWPFAQIPAAGKPPVPDVTKTPVKKLHPWMPSNRAEGFWSDNDEPASMEETDAALALIVHRYYSFGGNSKIDDRDCVNGSPGIRYPGLGCTATEVLWQGESLFETLLMNTPKSWVEGQGLPAWADPECLVSRTEHGGAEHPLWRATWGSNTARCRWEDGRLTAVSIGATLYWPPTMGRSKEARKQWWDDRNTKDTFYLYVDVENKGTKGAESTITRRAQRLDFGRSDTDLAVEWHSNNLSAEVKSRSTGAVLTPRRSTKIFFLRHLVEGTASSPVVRQTEVLVSSPKKWIVGADRSDAVVDAASQIKSILRELCKPFSLRSSTSRGDLVGLLAVLRERKVDVETAFWRNVFAPFEEFIINGAGDSVDPAVWPQVRDAAMAAFDEVISSSPGTKLAPLVMTARSRISRNISTQLGLSLRGKNDAGRDPGA